MSTAQTISVKVHPGSKTSKVEAISPNHLKVRLSASAQKGEANRQLLNFLSKHLRVPKNRLEIIKGLRSSHKIIKIAAPPSPLSPQSSVK